MIVHAPKRFTLSDQLRRMVVGDEVHASLSDYSRNQVSKACWYAQQQSGWRFKSAEVNGRVIVWRVS